MMGQKRKRKSGQRKYDCCGQNKEKSINLF